MATEKRLIADALKKYHDARFTPGVYEHSIFGKAALLLETDAVEVVHGYWIFKHNPITDPKKYFIRIVCSECNLHTGQKSNYCPNCGAKMDGGADCDNL